MTPLRAQGATPAKTRTGRSSVVCSCKGLTRGTTGWPSGIAQGRGVLLFAIVLGALGCSRTEFGSDPTVSSTPVPAGDVSANDPGVNKSSGKGGAGGPSPVAGAPSVVMNPYVTSNDLQITCGAKEVKANILETETRAPRIFIPMSCTQEQIVRPDPNRGMDIVFVHDVSGSMRSQVDIVREGYQELVRELTGMGWRLRIGALAFADQVDEVIPLNTDAAAVYAATNSSKPAWSAVGGYGGDVPDQGLLAMECALEILVGQPRCVLQSSAQTLTDAHDKSLVYVSNSPARNSAGKFDLGPTADKLRQFAQAAEKKGASFRLFHSVSDSRYGFPSEDIPTPVEQMANLLTLAGVSNVKVTYPLTPLSFKAKVMAKLTEGKVITESCALAAVQITGPDGTPLLPETQITARSGGAWIYPLEKLAQGSFTVDVERSCSRSGTQNSKVLVEL